MLKVSFGVHLSRKESGMLLFYILFSPVNVRFAVFFPGDIIFEASCQSRKLRDVLVCFEDVFHFLHNHSNTKGE